MNHKEIDLLRLRSFTLGTKLSDEEVVGAKGMERIAELITCIEPFVSSCPTLLLSMAQPQRLRRAHRNTTRSMTCEGVSLYRHEQAKLWQLCVGSAAHLLHRQLQRQS